MSGKPTRGPRNNSRRESFKGSGRRFFSHRGSVSGPVSADNTRPGTALGAAANDNTLRRTGSASARSVISVRETLSPTARIGFSVRDGLTLPRDTVTPLSETPRDESRPAGTDPRRERAKPPVQTARDASAYASATKSGRSSSRPIPRRTMGIGDATEAVLIASAAMPWDANTSSA
jgi:hypothetical protein